MRQVLRNLLRAVIMSIKSVGALIDWASNVHGSLARCLESAVAAGSEELAGQLLEYLAGHEQRLATIIAGFAAQGEDRALHTRVYDYYVSPPVAVEEMCGKPWQSMTFDQISQEVLAVHNQVIEFYRYLIGRSGKNTGQAPT